MRFMKMNENSYYMLGPNLFAMFWAIWYCFYNLKNVKNTHGEVILSKVLY